MHDLDGEKNPMGPELHSNVKPKILNRVQTVEVVRFHLLKKTSAMFQFHGVQARALKVQEIDVNATIAVLGQPSIMIDCKNKLNNCSAKAMYFFAAGRWPLIDGTILQ